MNPDPQARPQPQPPKPTITNATITPATLPAGGGMVTINATVTNATVVTLDGVAVKLPTTQSATASRSLRLDRAPATGTSASLAVTVAPPVEPPIEPPIEPPVVPSGTVTMFPGTFPKSADGYDSLVQSSTVIFSDGRPAIFGGGHADTANPDLWRFDGAKYVSDYPALPRSEMNATYLDAEKWWHHPDPAKYRLQPITRHTYTGWMWSSKLGKAVVLGPSQGEPYPGGYPDPAPQLTGGTNGIYDDKTRTWTQLHTNLVDPTVANADDPVSGNILGLRQTLWYVYDPAADTVVKRDTTTNWGLGYEDVMVHYPPNDKFYYITRIDWDLANSMMPVVHEVAVDRSTWTFKRTKLPFRRVNRGDKLVYGATHYAFDPVSKLIIGGMEDDKVWGVLPADIGDGRTPGWYQHPAPGAGTGLFHHWARDKNGTYWFVNTAKQVGAFRPTLDLWRYIEPPPLEVVAPITVGGQTYPSLAEALKVGDTMIGVGVLYVGGQVTKALTITGAGKDVTTIKGGGSILGKGAIVIEAAVAVTVTAIGFDSVAVSDGNGAGIRQSNGDLTVNDCGFTNCQDGYLGSNCTVAFNRCAFVGNGLGDGQTHAVYVSNGSKVASATDCTFKGTKIGHHFKSRALQSNLLRCTMEAGTESYSCNYPWGGKVSIKECNITKGPNSDNDNCVISYGEESGNATPYTDNTFGMSDTTITYTGALPMTAVRFSPDKVPCDAVFTNVKFVGIAKPQTGARTCTFVNCTLNGQPL